MFLAAVLVYLAALIAASIWHFRAVRTKDDFLVAGRTLPARVLVFTLLSTWIGSGSLFGGAGLGYRVGFPALWQSAGAWVGIAVAYFLAPRVRRIAQYTMPDILELRYGVPARVLGTITTVIAYTTIAAYQFRGGGRLLNLIADVDPAYGALITAGFCVAFTALAGMRSVAYLDIGNGLMMIVGVGAAVAYLVAHAGGPGPALNALRLDQTMVFGTLPPVEGALAVFLPTMLLLMGEANMYQKFFSAKDERAARRAVAGWIIGTIVVETLIVSVGVFGSVAVPGLDTSGSETIVIRVAREQLPVVLGILLLCGSAAIIVSTANSFLLTPATNLTQDIYRRFVNPNAADRVVLLVTRMLVVVLAALGLIALNFFRTILEMALWAYTMYGAAITPALLAAFLWPRVSRAGGTASILAGMTVTLFWEIFLLKAPGIAAALHLGGISTIYPALIASMATLIAVSLMRPDRTPEGRMWEVEEKV
jgi:SSS family solute:Na+ symporter/sodium/proline symporter